MHRIFVYECSSDRLTLSFVNSGYVRDSALEEQQSLLAQLNHLGRFPLQQNGLLLGAALREPSCLPFRTAPISLTTMETTSRVNSLRSTPPLTNASYGTTPPSETSSVEDSPCCSLTPSVSSTSTLLSSSPMACSMAEEQKK